MHECRPYLKDLCKCTTTVAFQWLSLIFSVRIELVYKYRLLHSSRSLSCFTDLRYATCNPPRAKPMVIIGASQTSLNS